MFIRKPLGYDFNSLEPFIDEETMYEHYDKHYLKYTENLNKALEKQNIVSNNIVQVIKEYSNITEIRNNGGGFYNHLLYFENLSPFPNTYNAAIEDLKNMINRDFGSYENFLKIFKEAGLSVFGSGWVWLVNHNGKLQIAITKNQDNPIMSLNCDVLLGMDVWEHAYYLKHKSNRASYIDDFLEIIDWKVVSRRL
jgi:Fe-Mn family superoxide dismutase